MSVRSAACGVRRTARRFWGVALLSAALLPAGCSNGGDGADAYGNFEATETLVSAEASGRLLRFHVDEGETLTAGQVVGLIDTLQLALKRDQVEAQRRASGSRIAGVLAQIAVLEEQKRVALVEQARLDRLLADEAATPKQRDDVAGQVAVIDRQIQQIRTQNATILGEVEALAAQVAQIEDQIRRSVVVNPVDGAVLVTYAAPHEMTAAGKPLYKIAALDTMYLRAYVSGAQLPHVRLGDAVEVLIDESAEANRSLPGVISWIASEAEFTPKLIQTKEERVNLVYAVKVRVANPDGVLKIGMPGEVVLGDSR